MEKTLVLGKIEGRRRGSTEDEVVGWHHRLDGRESETVIALEFSRGWFC